MWKGSSYGRTQARPGGGSTRVSWRRLKDCAAVLAATVAVLTLMSAPGISSVSLLAPFQSDDVFDRYDWHEGPRMLVPRANPEIVSLGNGEVFATGGMSASGPLSSTEIFSPTDALWRLGPTMTKRVGHTATVLPDGRVLVAGGETGSGVISSAEILDPASVTSIQAASMNFARVGHEAILLPNGEVLVTGGTDWRSGVFAFAESYDPSTNRWSPAGAMDHPRLFFSIEQLENGTIVAIGGDTTGTSEQFAPSTRTWYGASSMTSQRYGAAATTLSNGKILVAGGSAAEALLNTSEIYDPISSSWTRVGNMSDARSGFSLSALPNGAAIAAGSWSSAGSTNSTDLFDPATSSWTTGDPLSRSRGAHGSAMLSGGRVMVIGGRVNGLISSSVEILSATPVEPSGPCMPIELVPLVQAAEELPGNSSNGLIAKLISAQKQYDLGNFSVCLNIMHAFYNQFRAFAHNGHMDRGHAAALYEGYVSVVECIGGVPEPPTEEMLAERVSPLDLLLADLLALIRLF